MPEKKYNIAYLCGTNGWGGLEMNQIRNAYWMQKRGHFVKIYCLKDSPTYKACVEQNLPFEPIRKHKNHLDIINALRLLKKLKKDKIQHLFFRATFDMSIAASIRFYSRGKIKTHFFMEMDFASPKKQFFRTLRYSLFDSWNCPLIYLKQQVINNTNVNTNKINVIPSGLDFSKVIDESKTISREKLNLPKDRVIFGIVGRIDPKKGQLLALKAINIMNHENALLVLVGEETPDSPSDYLKEINRFITKNNLQNSVKLLPFQKNPFVVFNAFDCTLMTSDSETFGMVTIESMAQGVPVIGSDAGGTIELLEFGESGLLFETKNEEDLAKKMMFMLQNPNFFSKGLLSKSVQKFNHKKVCEKIEVLLGSFHNHQNL